MANGIERPPLISPVHPPQIVKTISAIFLIFGLLNIAANHPQMPPNCQTWHHVCEGDNSEFNWYSNDLCRVRPFQTAFGRVLADGHHGARPRIGSLLGSAMSQLPFSASRRKPFPKLNGSTHGPGATPKLLVSGHQPDEPAIRPYIRRACLEPIWRGHLRPKVWQSFPAAA